MMNGIPYFCNTSVPHFGMNPIKEERIGLNFHVSSDEDIMRGMNIDPEKEDHNIILQNFFIPWKKELYENYSQNYKILIKYTDPV